jgi:hypothetical protein
MQQRSRLADNLRPQHQDTHQDELQGKTQEGGKSDEFERVMSSKERRESDQQCKGLLTMWGRSISTPTRTSCKE